MQFEGLVSQSSIRQYVINCSEQYRPDYKLIREEPVFGLILCKTYLQKNVRTNEIVLCIEETFYDTDSEKIIDMLEEMAIVNGCNFLNQFIGFAYENISDGAIRIYILSEYYEMNLYKMIKKKQFIDKNLIEQIAHSFLQVIVYLQKKRTSLLAISLTNIQLKSLSTDYSQAVKILHFPLMQSQYDIVVSEQESHYNCFLSVEELEILYHNKPQEEYESLNLASTSLFSVGAMLLEIMNSGNPDITKKSKIYARDSFRIDQDNFLMRIHYAAEKYPKKLLLLLEQLLKFKGRNKPKQILQQYENSFENDMATNSETSQEAVERIYHQMYSDFPIKNEVVISPNSEKYSQARNNINEQIQQQQSQQYSQQQQYQPEQQQYTDHQFMNSQNYIQQSKEQGNSLQRQSNQIRYEEKNVNSIGNDNNSFKTSHFQQQQKEDIISQLPYQQNQFSYQKQETNNNNSQDFSNYQRDLLNCLQTLEKEERSSKKENNNFFNSNTNMNNKNSINNNNNSINNYDYQPNYQIPTNTEYTYNYKKSTSPKSTNFMNTIPEDYNLVEKDLQNQYLQSHKFQNDSMNSSLSNQLRKIEQVQQNDSLPHYESNPKDLNSKGSLKINQTQKFDSFYQDSKQPIQTYTPTNGGEIDFYIKGNSNSQRYSNNSQERESGKKQRSKWDLSSLNNSASKIQKVQPKVEQPPSPSLPITSYYISMAPDESKKSIGQRKSNSPSLIKKSITNQNTNSLTEQDQPSERKIAPIPQSYRNQESYKKENNIGQSYQNQSKYLQDSKEHNNIHQSYSKLSQQSQSNKPFVIQGKRDSSINSISPIKNHTSQSISSSDNKHFTPQHNQNLFSPPVTEFQNQNAIPPAPPISTILSQYSYQIPQSNSSNIPSAPPLNLLPPTSKTTTNSNIPPPPPFFLQPPTSNQNAVSSSIPPAPSLLLLPPISNQNTATSTIPPPPPFHLLPPSSNQNAATSTIPPPPPFHLLPPSSNQSTANSAIPPSPLLFPPASNQNPSSSIPPPPPFVLLPQTNNQIGVNSNIPPAPSLNQPSSSGQNSNTSFIPPAPPLSLLPPTNETKQINYNIPSAPPLLVPPPANYSTVPQAPQSAQTNNNTQGNQFNIPNAPPLFTSPQNTPSPQNQPHSHSIGAPQQQTHNNYIPPPPPLNLLQSGKNSQNNQLISPIPQQKNEGQGNYKNPDTRQNSFKNRGQESSEIPFNTEQASGFEKSKSMSIYEQSLFTSNKNNNNIIYKTPNSVPFQEGGAISQQITYSIAQNSIHNQRDYRSPLQVSNGSDPTPLKRMSLSPELKQVEQRRIHIQNEQELLEKESNDVLLKSKSSLELSSMLLEKLKQKNHNNQPHSPISESRKIRSTLKNLTNEQEKQLMSLHNSSLANNNKQFLTIKPQGSEYLNSNHEINSNIFASFNPNDPSSSNIRESGNFRSKNSLTNSNHQPTNSYKFPTEIIAITQSYSPNSEQQHQHSASPESPSQQILLQASKYRSSQPYSNESGRSSQCQEQIKFSKEDPFLNSHDSPQESKVVSLSDFQDFKTPQHKLSLYPSIPERSMQSETEVEENSLIANSPIQDLVLEQLNQQEKNKDYYLELRKRKPQKSEQFSAQEFDSITNSKESHLEQSGQRDMRKSQQQLKNMNSGPDKQLDHLIEDSPYTYTQTSEFQPENFSKSHFQQAATVSNRFSVASLQKEDIKEGLDNNDEQQQLVYSEFEQFEQKENLLKDLLDKLKRYPDVKKITYQNANYEGQVLKTHKSVIRDGYGIYKTKNGDIYCGQFKNNHMEGEGSYFYNHGDMYKGTLHKSLRQGSGTYYYANQNIIYQGEWIGNIKEGYGRLLIGNGERYEGYFKQNLKCGRGQYYFVNGDKFEGDWIYDKKCGKGVLEFKDGSVFEGNFYDDLPYGQGNMAFSNGDQYKGNYEDGAIAGFGVYIHAKDNQYYEGDFSHNQINGEGYYYFKNGDKYHGQYKDGQREGFGVYQYSNGCIYEGMWLENKKQGDGKFSFPDGTSYSGQFVQSMKSGFGKQTFKGGEFYSGHWKNDQRNGHGFYLFSDESYFDGDWLNDKMHGEGTYNLKTTEGVKKIKGFWNDNDLYKSTLIN